MDDREPPVTVRWHPRGRELRVGMVCSSVVANDSPLTGDYWDLLALPLLWLPPGPSCLMLGLGAGSVARLLRALDHRARLVAVEVAPSVVELARREFELDALDVEVVIADAHDALRRDDARYDLVIEDIFVDRQGAARKPEWLPEPGLELAAARLREGGVLVTNNLAEADAAALALRRRFDRVLCVEQLDGDNRIFLASDNLVEPDALRELIERHALLWPVADGLQISRSGATGAEPRG